MTIIYDATATATDKSRTYLDILSEVPDGGYIYSHGRFLRRTGWRSAVAVDMRHLDHENGSGADLLAFLENVKADRLEQAGRRGLGDMLADLEVQHEQALETADLADYEATVMDASIYNQ